MRIILTKDIKLCTTELERKFENQLEMEMEKMYNSLMSEFTENEPYGLLSPEMNTPYGGK